MFFLRINFSSVFKNGFNCTLSSLSEKVKCSISLQNLNKVSKQMKSPGLKILTFVMSQTVDKTVNHVMSDEHVGDHRLQVNTTLGIQMPKCKTKENIRKFMTNMVISNEVSERDE